MSGVGFSPAFLGQRELGLKRRRVTGLCPPAPTPPPGEKGEEGEEGARPLGPCAQLTTQSPPFALAFGPARGGAGSHLLAAAEEDGTLSVLRVRQALAEGAQPSLQCCSSWGAHGNAIFDVTWSQDSLRLVTASGDKTVKVWDTETRQLLGVLPGHTGSVKCAALHAEQDVLASASRDGAVRLWDLRNAAQGAAPADSFPCVGTIWDAHPVDAPGSACHVAGGKKPARPPLAARTMNARGGQGRRQAAQVPLLKAKSPGAVTSLLFLKGPPVLATAGASSGDIKLWDVRDLSVPLSVLGGTSTTTTGSSSSSSGSGVSSNSRNPVPGGTRAGAAGVCRRGITSLAQDSSGSLLLASHTDHKLRVYRVAHADQGPVHSLEGHRVGSFFVKARLSPNDSLAVSGSSCGSVFCWQAPLETARGPQHPPQPRLMRQHGACEVTGLDICPEDPWLVASCSDDGKVLVGSVALPREGKSNVFGIVSSRRVYA